MGTDDQSHSDSPAHASYTLDKPPCCLAFSPVNPALLVVGTYNLRSRGTSPEDAVPDGAESNAARRDGGLTLFVVGDDAITHLQTLENRDGGILDLVFDDDTIHAATSVGTIDIYELQPSATSPQPLLQLRSKIRVAEPTTIITSIALRIPSYGHRRIASTDSEGRISLLELPVSDPGPAIVSTYTSHQGPPIHDFTSHIQLMPQQHTLEAWITAFSPSSWSPRTIFSGGDDATLLSHVEHTPDEWTVGLSDRKTHGAGVTALLPLDLSGELGEQRLLLTGGYDDRLRVLDLGPGGGSYARRPEVVGELDLGGGVWRIKVLDQYQGDAGGKSMVRLTLAVACMYAGAFVVEACLQKRAEAAWECKFDVLQHMEEHKSMCYGIDMRCSGSNAKHDVVSCSFYDRRLCLWQWPKRH